MSTFWAWGTVTVEEIVWTTLAAVAFFIHVHAWRGATLDLREAIKKLMSSEVLFLGRAHRTVQGAYAFSQALLCYLGVRALQRPNTTVGSVSSRVVSWLFILAEVAMLYAGVRLYRARDYVRRRAGDRSLDPPR